MEGERDGGRERWREVWWDVWRKVWKDGGWMEGESDGGRERWREGETERPERYIKRAATTTFAPAMIVPRDAHFEKLVYTYTLGKSPNITSYSTPPLLNAGPFSPIFLLYASDERPFSTYDSRIALKYPFMNSEA